MTSESHVRRYLVVWLVLLALTALSYVAAQVHLGPAGTAVGLGIAAVKATLVALFFMHLIEEHFVILTVGVITVLWVVMICLGVFADVGLR